MLTFVGLGLADETDVTVKGLEAIRRASRVYLEAYTSILLVDAAKLENYYGRSVIVADREMVESGSEQILAEARTQDVAFLVVGDPFGSATTHTDLVLRAREKGIAVEIVHNASILNAVGACGLQLYNFGQTVSMVFFTETWQPASYYDRVAENAGLGLHTLLLLDIKVKEPTLESLARGRSGIFEPPRYMSAAQCAQQMLITEAQRGQGVCHADRLAVAVARLGAQDQRIVAGTLSELASLESNGPELGPPLHSLVLLGSRTHPLERDYIRPSALDSVSFDTIWHRDYETK